MDKLKCLYCGKELIDKQKKYCSIKHQMRIWTHKNMDKCVAYKREWRIKHKEKYQASKKRCKKNYQLRYPERYKAGKYAHYHKQRDKVCFKCNSITDLHFHHTNYIKKQGITLCQQCHKEIHKIGG